MGVLYFFALLALLLGAGPAFASARNQYARLGRVHVLVALLGAAYAKQTALSFFLELWHLAVFARDGKGLQWRHTFVAADFAAEDARVSASSSSPRSCCSWRAAGPPSPWARWGPGS